MESFEQFVAVAMEAEGLVVSEAVKFPVRRVTAKQAYTEQQTHGYEVDLVGARADQLVLATVKSYLGSRGVVAAHVLGEGSRSDNSRYILLNEPEVRDQVLASAAERYGYNPSQVHLRLYVGRFAAPTTGTHEARIREWTAAQHVGAGPIGVYGLDEVAKVVRSAAATTTYRNNPVLVAMKVLDAAGMLRADTSGIDAS